MRRQVVRSARRQQGAATLVVVMVLFFIMAMMAAFANRNLIFEQRIASNYYRSGVALEVADAGADWALGMLNGINVDQACVPSGSATNSFSERYLTTAPATRNITPTIPNLLPAASCVRVAGQQGWTCQCPNSNWTPAVTPESNQMQPSFDIRFEASGRPGVVRIKSTGCTGSLSTACSDQTTANNQLLGWLGVRVEAALVSALKMPPAMPLTVRGSIAADSNGIGLHNTDTRSNGLLLLTGSTVPILPADRLDSLPGTPGGQALISDPNLLTETPPAKMFKMFFGMAPTQYRNQPAMRVIRCDGGDCSATLQEAYNRGIRMVWVDGTLILGSNLQLGTAARPMVIVADGPLILNGPMRVFGLLYARGNVEWNNSSGQLALLNGALMSEGSLQVTGIVDLWYQAEIIDALSNGLGSFVRVPGSWWDN